MEMSSAEEAAAEKTGHATPSARRFRLRALTSTSMALSAGIVVLTSVALYFAPGRGVARNSGSSALLLVRDALSDAHVIFGFAVIALAFYHVWLNRKALSHYVRRRRAEARGVRLEAITAVVATAAALVFVLGARGAASTVSNYGNALANEQVRTATADSNGTAVTGEAGWRGGRGGAQGGSQGNVLGDGSGDSCDGSCEEAGTSGESCTGEGCTGEQANEDCDGESCEGSGTGAGQGGAGAGQGRGYGRGLRI